MDDRNEFKNDSMVDVIPRGADYVQESFDLNRLDNFVKGLGVQWLHYKAMPSPIGQKDRGDYRRSDGVDTITSNGMIYTFAGKFTAAITDNSRERKWSGAGPLDPSQGLLVMPRFYDTNTPDPQNPNCFCPGDRIYLMPGDRLYVADPRADVKVSNAHKMDYNPDGFDQPMFAIEKLEVPIIDSQNIEYKEGIDFCITKDGNISWIPGGNSPGVDPTTGKGRTYSVRYLYRAYYYIAELLKELRITNITIDNERIPERAAYHPLVQREYIYHNQNRGDRTNQLIPKDQKRVAPEPVESTNPAKYSIPVDMSMTKRDEE
jgi:hypothetical protein